MACSVLDPVLLNLDEVTCTVCRNVLHYRKIEDEFKFQSDIA